MAGISIVLAGFLLWRARPQAADVGPRPPVVVASPDPVAPALAAAAFAPTATAAPTGEPPEDPGIVVDVQGKVARPGVVNLPTGARVRDALNAVGGPRKGISTRSLNLAAPLSDGDQVVLGPPCESAAAPVTPVPASSGPPRGAGRADSTRVVVGPTAQPALIDLNRASAAELETLPGVGPVLAQRIIDYRMTRGRFTSVDELREVSGIGPAKFAEIRSRVRV